MSNPIVYGTYVMAGCAQRLFYGPLPLVAMGCRRQDSTQAQHASRLKRLAIVLSVALLAGCGDLARHIRQHTYPPDFKYIDQAQVQSAMWRLAADVTALDRVMRQSAPSDAARRAEVRRLLGTMDDATSALRTAGRPTNHPLIGDHIEQFRRDLALARAGVELEPPNYYLVGSVAGACLTCHAAER